MMIFDRIRFRRGDEGHEDGPHVRGRPVMNDEALEEVVESNPRQTTRELALKFEYSHMTIRNYLNAIGKRRRCGKQLSHQLRQFEHAGYNQPNLAPPFQNPWLFRNSLNQETAVAQQRGAAKPDPEI
ncbi:hypothetical protein ANCDUO_22735 [Ancylostoma duodenale]|uniref:Uncharacterized protein n=1 Tax=Ancylostoma duodenale TaxID=51022 RepID=A0A0C2FQI3_9BILA|nr:hypothetical protein ANCDUO_22735 [Ancylostoma duodenale]